ncbi:MAG: hypothetical protein ABSA50_01895 [Candidatus Bathyarchaeia archaeon]
MPRIPIIQDLLSGTVPPGSNFLVEFDSKNSYTIQTGIGSPKKNTP